MNGNEEAAGFDAAYGRALGGGTDEVDAAASVLAASGPEWDAVAGRTATRVVRDLAARGWQPADLVRMAGRELTARHQRLAAALADDGASGEHGRPGPDEGSGRPGDRGGPGAPGAPGGLAGFARAERLDRFSAAAEFVELLCLYGRLPRIAALPTGGPAPAAPKQLGRIRALLAKAESTAFPEEAEALSAKAQHLMARHSIDAALLAASSSSGPGGGSGGGEGPGARRIGVDRPYEGAKALLLDAVAEANRCQAVWSADFGFSTVVGHGADLESVEVLYTSLLVQAERALRAGRVSRSRDFRESFLLAYAVRVRARLTAATEQETAADPSPDLLPALASREAAVAATTNRLFPSTTPTRLRGARDADGWREGDAAATSAHL